MSNQAENKTHQIVIEIDQPYFVEVACLALDGERHPEMPSEIDAFLKNAFFAAYKLRRKIEIHKKVNTEKETYQLIINVKNYSESHVIENAFFSAMHPWEETEGVNNFLERAYFSAKKVSKKIEGWEG